MQRRPGFSQPRAKKWSFVSNPGGEIIMKIRNTVTAAVAAAGLCVAGLGAFAAGPASAATTSARHHIKHPIKAVAVCSGKGQLGWTSGGQRYQCKKPSGWRFYRWVRDPVTPPAPPAPPAPPVPPVLGLSPWQQIQNWAVTSGNAAWYQVFHTDTNRLATDEATTPSILAGPAPLPGRLIDTTPGGTLQGMITADAQDLVTDAQAALAAPPPGNFTASWDTIMTDQVNYGTLIAGVGNAADWGQYTFSQPDATAAEGMAVSDDLTAIQAVPINVPSLTTIVAPSADLTLDNGVINWLDTTLGNLANEDFSVLGATYYPLTATSYPTGNGTAIVADADAALLALPPGPGNLATPFSNLASEYVVIGDQIVSSAAVTSTMITNLNTDVAAWQAALALDGADVPTWFAHF